MSFLLFIAVIVLVVLLVSKKSDTPTDDRYIQGYWDGYRALGEKVQHHLHQEQIDRGAVQREIDAGFSDMKSRVSEESLEDPIVSLPESTAFQPYIESPEPVKKIDKEQQSISNLNTLLFVASLLFVAAGAAFVAAAMPDTIKLVGVWILVAAFYGVGMMLRNTSRLKAAGTAFIGTSLGLIPFAGIALYQLANVPAPVAWTLTSLVGVIAYFYAALKLQSQVVSYLTLAFVVSLASSFAESVSVPLMWNFVLIIAVSLIANILSYFKPTWIPALFIEPIERTGQLVTPLALVSSLAVADQLPLYAYEIVFGVATLHYVVVWLQTRHRGYETAVRVLAHVTLFLMAIDIFNNEAVPIGIGFLVLASIQQIYSFARYRNDAASMTYEWSWVHTMQFLQFASPLFWLTTSSNAELTTVAYIVLGISSAGLTIRSRRAIAALPGVLMTIVLPFIVARWLVEPVFDWEVLASWFTLAAAAIIGSWSVISRRSREVGDVMSGAFLAYVGLAICLALLSSVGWSTLFFMALAGLLWRSSYLMEQSVLSILGSVAFVIAIVYGWQFFELNTQWLALGVAWFASLILYLAHRFLIHYKDRERAFGLLGVVWATLGIAVAISFFDVETNVAAALTIVAGASTLAIEGYRRQDKQFIEIAAYVATFGLQRTAGLLWPELNVVFYAHWWALTAAAMAVWRQELTTRLIIAMSFVTASTGLYALGEGGFYQLLFLIEHLGLLVVGALTAKRWAIWWGLIASVLAVLYFLRDIAFLAFAFLGLVVIGTVIWRLTKVGREHPE